MTKSIASGILLTEAVHWCLSLGLISSVPLRGRGCCNRNDTLFVPPAAHFFTQKSVEKALRGHPLKPHFTGGFGIGSLLLITAHPRRKHPAFAPLARYCMQICFFLPLLRGAFLVAAAYRTPAKQGTPIKRHKFAGENCRSVRAGQTIRLFRSARALYRIPAEHWLKGDL